MDIIYFLPYLIPPLVIFYSVYKVDISGTDQYYHFWLIDAIRQNNNRFVSSIPFMIGENRMGYPQLLHWSLARLSNETILKLAKYFPVIFHLLSSLSLFAFIQCLYYYAGQQKVELPDYYLVQFLAGLAYASTPYHYDLLNAKNIGLSARGLGLWLGQLFVYQLILFLISADYLFLITMSICALIMLLSSTFAMQFLVLSLVIVIVLFKNLLLIVPLLLAIVVYATMMPKVFKAFVLGQFGHKYLYAKYLGKKYILASRHSIWRDFIYDFWRILFGKSKDPRYVSKFERFKYIATNPVVLLITSLPFYLIVIYLKINGDIGGEYGDILFKVTMIGMILFLLTSFRFSRFLGEPERYLEFCYSIICLICAFNYTYFPMIFNIVIAYSFIFFLFRLFVYIKARKGHKNLQVRNEIEKIRAYLLNSKERNLKVMSNSTQATKVLFSEQYQVFWHPVFQESIAGFHFNDLYSDSFNFMDEEIFPKLIKTIKPDYFILDSSKLKNNELAPETAALVQLHKTFGPIKLYKCL